jgi:hypothetical protein
MPRRVGDPVMGGALGVRERRVLQLDRTARRNHCRGEQRDDVTRAGEGADRGGDSGAGSSARGRRSAAGDAARSRSAAATDTQQLGGHPDRPECRNQRRELPADPADLAAELTAAATVANVAPGQPARANAPIVGDDQILSDCRAGGVSRLAGLGQADTGPDQQRLHGRNRDRERPGDVRIGHAAELTHQQGRALLLGKTLHVCDQSSQRVALLDLGDRIVGGPNLGRINRLGGQGIRPPKLIDAAVVRNPVQPRSERELAIGGQQAGVCPHEDLLNGVLGVGPGAAEHLTCVDEQPVPVTVVDDAEGIVVTRPEERDELLVGANSQQRSAKRDPRSR